MDEKAIGSFFSFERSNSTRFLLQTLQQTYWSACPRFCKAYYFIFKIENCLCHFLPRYLIFRCLCWCFPTFHDVSLPPTVSRIVWNHSRMCVHVHTHDTNNTWKILLLLGWRLSVKLSARWVMATSSVWRGYSTRVSREGSRVVQIALTSAASLPLIVESVSTNVHNSAWEWFWNGQCWTFSLKKLKAWWILRCVCTNKAKRPPHAEATGLH